MKKYKDSPRQRRFRITFLIEQINSVREDRLYLPKELLEALELCMTLAELQRLSERVHYKSTIMLKEIKRRQEELKIGT